MTFFHGLNGSAEESVKAGHCGAMWDTLHHWVSVVSLGTTFHFYLVEVLGIIQYTIFTVGRSNRLRV